MKKLFLCLLLLFIIPMSCQAHSAIGYRPERTTACMDAISDYFQNKYNLTLKENVIVYVTKTTQEYIDVLRKFNYPNPKFLGETTHAITSEGNGILINGEAMHDRHFYFILAHEMVHKYQQEKFPDLYDNYGMMEGEADLIAKDISLYDVTVADHGIPYETLKTRDGFMKEKLLHNNDVLEQARFYAQQTPLLAK